MDHDNPTNPNTSLSPDTDAQTTAGGIKGAASSTANGRLEPGHAAANHPLDGKGGTVPSVANVEGHAADTSAVQGPTSSSTRSREDVRARDLERLAAAKERVKNRGKRDKAMVRKLLERIEERDAADRKRERRQHEKQGNAARYRFADALLKGLAKLQQSAWPPLIGEVIAQASDEDRAAIHRLVEQIRTRQSA